MEWLQNIVENVDENIDQQIEYSEKYLGDIETSLEEFKEEKGDFEGKLDTANKENADIQEQVVYLNAQLSVIENIEKMSFDLIEIANTELEFDEKMQRIRLLITQIDDIIDHNCPEDLKTQAKTYKTMLNLFDSVVNQLNLDQNTDKFQLSLSKLNSSVIKTDKKKQLEEAIKQ